MRGSHSWQRIVVRGQRETEAEAEWRKTSRASIRDRGTSELNECHVILDVETGSRPQLKIYKRGRRKKRIKRRRLIGEEMQAGTDVTQFDEHLWQ